MSTTPLIVSATYEEIALSIPTLERLHIPFLITGVGMVATTLKLSRQIMQYKYDYILNVGIAGSFDKEVQIGDIVEIYHDTFAELGAEDGDSFISIDELGFGEASFRNIPHQVLNTSLQQVKGITVNTVHGSQDSIDRILSRWPDISTESMEGAATFYVCQQDNIPCMQVRSISNYVEKRDRSKWNIPLAITNLNKWLIEFIDR